MNIILLGGPGSGKGTQAKRLQQELDLTHVASGDLFRDHLNRGTRLGLLAQEYMNRGDLVPDEVTIEMLDQRLQRDDVTEGVVLDGFPRTVPQAKALDAMLDRLGRRLHGVLHIQVPDEEIVERLSGRLVCRECQATFHRKHNPFEQCPEDRCRGEYLYQREDDRPDTVRARLATYRRQTAPLIEFYRERGMLETVDGRGSVEDVTRRCLQATERFAAEKQTS